MCVGGTDPITLSFLSQSTEAKKESKKEMDSLLRRIPRSEGIEAPRIMNSAADMKGLQSLQC